MRPLRKYEDYSRRDVHDIFDPGTVFQPSRGVWGMWGIVPVPRQEGDFVFFVTMGQKQGSHRFQEEIDENGILTWQSQPSQDLSDERIQAFIHHNHLVNNICLFLKTGRSLRTYTYLGRLAYVGHNVETENPVWFKWQILDWELPVGRAHEMNLKVQPAAVDSDVSPGEAMLVPPPARGQSGAATTKTFSGRKVDFAAAEAHNRELGKAGELFILQYEKDELIKAGRPDLADRVEYTAKDVGDGTGYDIRSWTASGDPKFIEVKTTTGGARTAFVLTARELAFSQRDPEHFHLYRVHDFSRKTNRGRFYVMSGDLAKEFTLEPTEYRARR